MNHSQKKGKWRQFEGEARRKWGKLTEDSWQVARGDMEKLAGEIQETYGDSKEAVMTQLSELMASLSQSAKKSAES